MLISKRRPDAGICFAWTPKWTPDGMVWLERVHYRYNDTEFGSYSYSRVVPEKYYGGVERKWDPLRDFDRRLCIAEMGHCHYPNCTCMNVDGSQCSG